MSWDELSGQARAVRTLTGGLAAGRPAHAYLFEGPAGAGKRLAARLFAQALLCARGAPEPCGECVSCRKVAAGVHPDAIWVRPAGASVKIGQVRPIAREVWLRPYEGRFRVWVVEDADKMTAEASNSILKLLEEPPAYAVIVLVTPNPGALPPTVPSRCQRVKFSPPVPSRPAPAGVRPGLVRLAHMLTHGDDERAAAVASSPELGTALERAFDVVEAAAGDKALFLQPLLDELESGALPFDFLDLLQAVVRELAVYQATGRPDLLVDLGSEGRAAGMVSSGERQWWREFFLVESCKRAISKNANRRLALEGMFLEL